MISGRKNQSGVSLIDVILGMIMLIFMMVTALHMWGQHEKQARRTNSLNDLMDLRNFVTTRMDCLRSLPTNPANQCSSTSVIPLVGKMKNDFVIMPAGSPHLILGKYQLRLRCPSSANPNRLLIEYRNTLKSNAQWQSLYGRMPYECIPEPVVMVTSKIKVDYYYTSGFNLHTRSPPKQYAITGIGLNENSAALGWWRVYAREAGAPFYETVTNRCCSGNLQWATMYICPTGEHMVGGWSSPSPGYTWRARCAKLKPNVSFGPTFKGPRMYGNFGGQAHCPGNSVLRYTKIETGGLNGTAYLGWTRLYCAEMYIDR
jgi:hypothetical protein